MLQDEPVDGPTGEYRKETVKKLKRENEVDTTPIGIQVMNLSHESLLSNHPTYACLFWPLLLIQCMHAGVLTLAFARQNMISHMSVRYITVASNQ